ncbi:chemotaxis protein [Thalassotalea euphylliae]|uniref:Chemotaxis protein n=1 Tax=Thalassotalea euphylliae TaxID=1655234 RepID=A0A3E0UJU0_9GAMM|nr:chemotaxis protein [Thalassotalea euphylliae]REL37221.1 chemotaxis protein [Thalassotalea euphylliae]
MSSKQINYFVTTALIAAKLDNANKIAKQLLLTASNARAVALRAGDSAAGFKPLTDFIDQLARVTIASSKQINVLATQLSRVSANKMRTDNAICHFERADRIATDYAYVESLSPAYGRIKRSELALNNKYVGEIFRLNDALDELARELRTAVILATLSRVEASQAALLYQESLNGVADNVELSARQIKTLIEEAKKLAQELHQDANV